MSFTRSVMPVLGQVRIVTLTLGMVIPSLFGVSADAAGWKAGVAKADITPDKPMWMSGYAGRDHRAEGTRTKLWGKVLVLEDGRGQHMSQRSLSIWSGSTRPLRTSSVIASSKSMGSSDPELPCSARTPTAALSSATI